MHIFSLYFPKKIFILIIFDFNKISPPICSKSSQSLESVLKPPKQAEYLIISSSSEIFSES